MAQQSDVVLQNTDGSSNTVELTLWKDSPSMPGGYQTGTTPFLPPRQPTDDANYQQIDPQLAMAYDVSSFHRGFGQGNDKEFGNEARYGYSDGVLAQFRDELTLGYQQDEVDIFLSDGRFEGDFTGSWTTSDITLAAETATTADIHSGDKSAKLTATDSNGTIYQRVSSSTVTALQNVKVSVIAYVKRKSGSGNIKMTVDDGSSATDSSTVTSTDWTLVQVDKTLSNSASKVEVKFTVGTSGDVFHIDDLCIIPAGGIDFPAQAIEFQGSFYVPCGYHILKWNESSVRFDSVGPKGNTTAYTDIAVYSGDGTSRLFVARGDTTAYQTATAPDGTSGAFTAAASGTANQNYAKYFARARNANGDFALAKSRSNTVAFSINPDDATSWGSEITVGDNDKAVTNLFAANDVLLIGKEDGLFSYDRSFNKFEDISPEANFFSGANNFKKVISRSGRIYATSGDRAFWSIPFLIPGDQWEDVSYLFRATSFIGFGGRASAIAQDVNNIYVTVPDDLRSDFISFPYSFPFSFPTAANKKQKIYLIAMSNQRDDPQSPSELVSHTISGFLLDEVQELSRYKDDTNNKYSMFVFGKTTNSDISTSSSSGAQSTVEPRIIRMRLPIENQHPALVSGRQLRKTGQFYTSFMDFNFPDQEKAAVKLTLEGENLDSDRTVTVSYKIETSGLDDTDNSTWTTFGDGEINSSGSQTLTASLTTPITFKRIRFKFALSSDSHTSMPPRIKNMVFHSVFNPVNFLNWKLQSKLLDARMTAKRLRGSTDTQVLSAVLSDLDTLRQKPFVLFTDLDGTQYRTRITDRTLIPIGRNIRRTSSAAIERSYILSLDLSEVKTS